MKITLTDEDFAYINTLAPAERKEAEEDLRFYKQEEQEALNEDLTLIKLILNAIGYHFNNMNKDNLFIRKSVVVCSQYDYDVVELEKVLSKVLSGKITLESIGYDEKFIRLFNKFITRDTVRIFENVGFDDICINFNFTKLLSRG